MNQKRVYELALKGIRSEIEAQQKTVDKGYSLLAAIRNHEPVKTKKSVDEIKEIIRNAQAKIKELCAEEYDISWEYSLMEQ